MQACLDHTSQPSRNSALRGLEDKRTRCHDHDQRRNADLLQGLGSEERQPIVFHHGWPLSSDDWTPRCSSSSARVPRRRARPARPRSIEPGQRWSRHGPLAPTRRRVEHLDLRNAIMSHSTVARGDALCRRHGQPRAALQARADRSGAAIMVKTPANRAPAIEVFDGFRKQLAAIARVLSRDRRALLQLQPTARARRKP